MGINGLFDIIKKLHPQLFKQVLFQDLACGRNVAIDIASPLYKYIYTYGEQWINGLIIMICFLKKYNIQATFVFDGKPPILKDREKDKRDKTKKGMGIKVIQLRTDLDEFIETGQKSLLLTKTMRDIRKQKQRSKTRRLLKRTVIDKNLDDDTIDIKLMEKKIEKLSSQIVIITKDHINSAKRLFDLLGVPYLQSSTEAETLCSYMVNRGICSIGVTEDSDMIVYGTEISVFKLDPSTGFCDVLYHSEVLDAFDMTKEKFRDFCIMCGTDYNDNISKVGPVKALKLLNQYETLEKMEEIDRGEGIRERLASGKYGKSVSFKNLKNYDEIRNIFDHIPAPKIEIDGQFVDIPNNFKHWENTNLETILESVVDIGEIYRTNIERLRDAWTNRKQIEIILD